MGFEPNSSGPGPSSLRGLLTLDVAVVIFRQLLSVIVAIAWSRAMLKVESRQRIGLVICESLRSKKRKLTYPEMGSTMEFDTRHLRWYWREISFQKDNGDTESRTSG
jgi:hypothetical protein